MTGSPHGRKVRAAAHVTPAATAPPWPQPVAAQPPTKLRSGGAPLQGVLSLQTNVHAAPCSAESKMMLPSSYQLSVTR